MKDAECLALAAGFLSERRIGYTLPGRIGRREEDRLEAIFPVPESLDPTVAVVDPSDVRVWVGIFDKSVDLIPQM